MTRQTERVTVIGKRGQLVGDLASRRYIESVFIILKGLKGT
jgi:hypothetical protein